MSIRPVEFNGMLQNQHGVSNQKQHEDAKPVVQQQQALESVKHQEQQRASQVKRKPDTDPQEYKFDARDEGKNKYQNHGQGKKKKSAKHMEDGQVKVKGASSGFDILV